MDSHPSGTKTVRPQKKKHRGKSNSIKEYCYDVPDTLFHHVATEDVTKLSAVTINTRSSSQPGKKTFVIRGTRSQIQEALRMITMMTGEKAEVLGKAQELWLEWVDAAFPRLEHQTYFLPPVFFRTVPTAEMTVSGLSVLVNPTQCHEDSSLERSPASSSTLAMNQTIITPNVQDSDLVDAEALQRVLFCLQKMFADQKETFMCLSQFPFGSYLGEPCYAPAVAHLPLPTNLPNELPWSWRQGDFDMLIIHQYYGFVVCEIKAVGCNCGSPNEKECENITKKLESALEQLNKAEAMLSHLASDIAPGLSIMKIIACPNLTVRQIQRAVSHNKDLEQMLCKFLKTKDPAEVFQMILCSDHLWSPETLPSVRDVNLEALRKWWQDCIVQPGPDLLLCSKPDLYRNLVARFCGPASTVAIPQVTEPRISIKTWDQAVRYVGDCYTAHMTLFPEQINLINKAPTRVFLTGPPGTGKTVVLFLMAVEWLRRGEDVQLLSTWERSLAVTLMLRHLLEHAIKKEFNDDPTIGKVRVLEKNFRRKEDVQATLDELTRAAAERPVYVIADEVGPDFESEYYIFPDFCAKLLDYFRHEKDSLHLWAECCQHRLAPEVIDDMDREEWEVMVFTRPLRSPPTVIREVKQAVEIRRDSTVHRYSERGVPDHTDGPPIKWLYHRPSLEGSRPERVEDCISCGRLLANFLLEKLRLDGNSTPLRTDDLSTGNISKKLQYTDFLILSWVDLREDVGILKALSEANIPVRVMKDSNIQDVATAHSNVVWAARQQMVGGLERKVVIVLNNYDDSKGHYVGTRLHAMSRCSSQLVVVCPPPGQDEE